MNDAAIPPGPLAGASAGNQLSVLLSDGVIAARVQELGAEISRDYAGKNMTVVGVLKGAILFMADLIRCIDLPVRCEFLGVSSYGDRQDSSGEVKVTADVTQPIHGQHVLIVEDIVDTGLTLSYIRRLFEARGPASIKICALLDKRERRVTPMEADYVGFVIPNKFVVGYGLDYKGLLRNLPYIGVMESTPEEGADAE